LCSGNREDVALAQVLSQRTIAAMPAANPSTIQESEVEIVAIRAQGAGGQNVNKVSSAIQLRFDIARSSLPEDVKHRLLALRDKRITREGVLILRAQRHRAQEMNRVDAMARLHEIIHSVAVPPKVRRATKPTFGSRQRRLAVKSLRAQTKAQRARVLDPKNGD
jgi:ribosome-associated protein